MTSNAALYQRVRRLLLAEAELFGAGAVGANVVRVDGVVASVNPHAPDRSMFNWVISDPPSALSRVYPQIAQRYAEAGVRAWTVWVDPEDEPSERWLMARGHKLDGRPRAMAADISELALPPAADSSWQETRDMGVVAAINDEAYGFPPPAFGAALVRCSNPRWRAYLALDQGKAVACALTYESSDADCGVTGVATLPRARGTGVASRLLAVALREAQRRGAQTTTLQATSKGTPIYARLGYRELGAMSMWEHRIAPP